MENSEFAFSVKIKAGVNPQLVIHVQQPAEYFFYELRQ